MNIKIMSRKLFEIIQGFSMAMKKLLIFNKFSQLTLLKTVQNLSLVKGSIVLLSFPMTIDLYRTEIMHPIRPSPSTIPDRLNQSEILSQPDPHKISDLLSLEKLNKLESMNSQFSIQDLNLSSLDLFSINLYKFIRINPTNLWFSLVISKIMLLKFTSNQTYLQQLKRLESTLTPSTTTRFLPPSPTLTNSQSSN